MKVKQLPVIRVVLMVVALACASIVGAAPVSALRVMTYNVLVGGTAGGQPLSRTAGVITAAQADVVGLQEIGSSGPALATMLGFYYYGFNSDVGVLSRYPFAGTYSQGVKLQVSPTQQAYIFDVHLAAYPYQPYDIRDGHLATEAQAISEAQKTRGAAVTGVLNSMSTALSSGAPVFLTGDFNEPSHLDWTQKAANAGLHFGRKVAWPASTAVVNAGMTDAFRELRPDEVLSRGDTWTPGSPAPNVAANEVHDRIDFVYYSGVNVSPTQTQVIGYTTSDGITDVAVQPYPSDHRSVVVQFSIPNSVSAGDLNGDSLVNAVDWALLRTNQFTNLTGLTKPQAFARGDLNGDFKNDHADFVLFKSIFESANGAGSFALLARVPEPASGAIAMLVLMTTLLPRRRRSPLHRQATRARSRQCPAPECLDPAPPARRPA
jgi:endonuclease/exonuclease/phosphatase family metal-dependent hydrolase